MSLREGMQVLIAHIHDLPVLSDFLSAQLKEQQRKSEQPHCNFVDMNSAPAKVEAHLEDAVNGVKKQQQRHRGKQQPIHHKASFRAEAVCFLINLFEPPGATPAFQSRNRVPVYDSQTAAMAAGHQGPLDPIYDNHRTCYLLQPPKERCQLKVVDNLEIVGGFVCAADARLHIAEMESVAAVVLVHGRITLIGIVGGLDYIIQLVAPNGLLLLEAALVLWLQRISVEGRAKALRIQLLNQVMQIGHVAV